MNALNLDLDSSGFALLRLVTTSFLPFKYDLRQPRRVVGVKLATWCRAEIATNLELGVIKLQPNRNVTFQTYLKKVYYENKWGDYTTPARNAVLGLSLSSSNVMTAIRSRCFSKVDSLYIFKPSSESTMLRSISRACYFHNYLAKPTFTTIRTLSGAATNEDLKINKLFDVSNFTAVVTGGGSGIGLMITQALASNGAKAYITGRRENALKTVVDKYSTGPGKIVA